MAKHPTIKLTVLAGEGYIVENGGDVGNKVFHFLMGMSRKGWLGRVASMKGHGLYLAGIDRLAGFKAYCEAQGFVVVTSA
jgi:hypothetical protein